MFDLFPISAIQQKATLKTVEGKEAKHAKLSTPKSADLPEIDDYERPELEKYEKPEFEKYDKPEKSKKVKHILTNYLSYRRLGFFNVFFLVFNELKTAWRRSNQKMKLCRAHCKRTKRSCIKQASRHLFFFNVKLETITK